MVEITNDDEYEQALALMDEAIDDYDDNPVLIELLSSSINRWENSSSELAAFNERINEGDPATPGQDEETSSESSTDPEILSIKLQFFDELNTVGPCSPQFGSYGSFIPRTSANSSFSVSTVPQSAPAQAS